jgi:hypothetical protein
LALIPNNSLTSELVAAEVRLTTLNQENYRTNEQGQYFKRTIFCQGKQKIEMEEQRAFGVENSTKG